MGKWFSLELHVDPVHLRLEYPRRVTLLLLAPAIIGLIILCGVMIVVSGFGSWWPLLLVWVALTAINAGWLLQWSKFDFDRLKDEVRRGPRKIGRLSDIGAIERSGKQRDDLQIVFRERNGALRKTRLGNFGEDQAVEVGTRLADLLDVPFRK